MHSSISGDKIRPKGNHYPSLAKCTNVLMKNYLDLEWDHFNNAFHGEAWWILWGGGMMKHPRLRFEIIKSFYTRTAYIPDHKPARRDRTHRPRRARGHTQPTAGFAAVARETEPLPRTRAHIPDKKEHDVRLFQKTKNSRRGRHHPGLRGNFTRY